MFEYDCPFVLELSDLLSLNLAALKRHFIPFC